MKLIVEIRLKGTIRWWWHDDVHFEMRAWSYYKVGTKHIPHKNMDHSFGGGHQHVNIKLKNMDKLNWKHGIITNKWYFMHSINTCRTVCNTMTRQVAGHLWSKTSIWCKAMFVSMIKICLYGDSVTMPHNSCCKLREKGRNMYQHT